MRQKFQDTYLVQNTHHVKDHRKEEHLNQLECKCKTDITRTTALLSKEIIYSTFIETTGCPVNWYSLSISIPDFPDGPMKKKLTLQF